MFSKVTKQTMCETINSYIYTIFLTYTLFFINTFEGAAITHHHHESLPSSWLCAYINNDSLVVHSRWKPAGIPHYLGNYHVCWLIDDACSELLGWSGCVSRYTRLIHIWTLITLVKNWSTECIRKAKCQEVSKSNQSDWVRLDYWHQSLLHSSDHIVGNNSR